jgi:hypothetical protein
MEACFRPFFVVGWIGRRGALERGIKCWQFFVGLSNKNSDKLDGACEAYGAYISGVCRHCFAKDVIFEKTKI